jgi:hypothetical protein
MIESGESSVYAAMIRPWLEIIDGGRPAVKAERENGRRIKILRRNVSITGWKYSIGQVDPAAIASSHSFT